MINLTDIFGEGATKAVIRKCKKKKISYEQFLFDFIMDYAEDEFFDYLYELCEKYHIKMDDETELEF